MNGSMKQFAAVAVFAALSAACGGTGSSSKDEAQTTATPMPTATPKALPDGIFVSTSGDDHGNGSLDRPYRTITKGIAHANGEGKRDVFVIGGGANGIYDEAVILRSNVHVQGSVCQPAVTDTALRIDNVACTTAITGGSPAVLGENVSDIEISDFEIDGAAPTGSTWWVDGAGCVGHGKIYSIWSTPCSVDRDADGREIPSPAIAVALSHSQRVTFTRSRIVSANAADGAKGIDGESGIDSTTAPQAGQSAGSAASYQTRGGDAATNPACASANGANGGRGGRWYLSAIGATRDLNAVYAGDAGASTPGAIGGAAAAVNILNQRGANGANGADGADGIDGAAGEAAIGNVDTLGLFANGGTVGRDGGAGFGGAGGGGGAPASRKAFVFLNGAWSFHEFAGGFPAGTITMHDVGEAAGGAGGAGAAAGCGGKPGHGGQGGASSVALLAMASSEVTLVQSQLLSGKGGAGAEGGLGGLGGAGGFGAAGGFGWTSAAQLNGFFSGDSWSVTATGFNGTQDLMSASVGGNGGRGGNGGTGGRGGKGGAGAGGWSIGIVSQSSSVATVSTTITNDAPGLSVDGGAAGSAKDILIAN